MFVPVSRKAAKEAAEKRRESEMSFKKITPVKPRRPRKVLSPKPVEKHRPRRPAASTAAK
jgi:hypothetical protein